MVDNKTFSIAIRQILVSEFSVTYNEQFVSKISETKGVFQDFTFEVNCSINGFEVDNIAIVTLQVFIYLDREKTIKLGNIQVENVFVIPDLKSYIDTELQLLDLPINLELSLISISLSHTRAILVSKSSTTPLNLAMLPIINPMDLLSKKHEETIPKVKK